MKFDLFWATTNGADWLTESFECNTLEQARAIATHYCNRTAKNADSLVKHWRSDGEEVDIYLEIEVQPWHLGFAIIAGIEEEYRNSQLRA